MVLNGLLGSWLVKLDAWWAVSCDGEHGEGMEHRKDDHEFSFRHAEFGVPKRRCQVGSWTDCSE